jgi:hypothetical protein
MLVGCEKDVVAPNDEAKGRDELFINMEGRNYLLREKGKFLYKKQYAKFQSVDDYDKPVLVVGGVDSLGLENYKLLIEIQDKERKNLGGGLHLDIRYNKNNGEAFAQHFKEYLWFNNHEIDSVTFTSFKINEIIYKNASGCINFDCNFDYSYDSTQTYHAYWKGDLRVIVSD